MPARGKTVVVRVARPLGRYSVSRGKTTGDWGPVWEPAPLTAEAVVGDGATCEVVWGGGGLVSPLRTV